MKSNYDVETYAEAFDAHNEFTGAITPSGLAAEFRGICEDADEEIAGLKARAEAAGAVLRDLDETLIEFAMDERPSDEEIARVNDSVMHAKHVVSEALAGHAPAAPMADQLEAVPQAITVQDKGDVILRLGSVKSFRCPCGCNVFREFEKDHYRCNSCGETFAALKENAPDDHIAQPGKMVGDREPLREIIQGLVSHLELCRDMDFPGVSEEDQLVLESVNAILDEARAALAENHHAS